VNNRVLIADDEADVLEMIGSYLTGAGFRVLTAPDGAAALASARRDHPALAVLDIMMPGMSGLDVTRVLKREAATAEIAILLLSARTEEVDRILGFELGADDYMTKPFSPRELVLRVKSILRRKGAAQGPTGNPRVGEITVDHERHVITVSGRPVTPTLIEFKLLTLLMERPGRVLSRDELLDRVWGFDNPIENRTVDTHIRRLREKLGAAGEQIQTVRGFGYRLDEH
jgi:two-component system, OmpR family, phosphate regulon response regulator PhoB